MLYRFLTLSILLVIFGSPVSALSTQDEIEIGRQAAARFEAEYGLEPNQAMQGRLRRIGQKLLASAERKELPWQFRVISVDEFNAAAFPGGFVYATRGLMNGLDDEELAFVVAHEIAHVDRRHSVRQLEKAQMTQLGMLAVLVGANRGLDIPQSQAIVANLANTVIQSGYSREHESEADSYGALLLSRAGYDPVFSILALQELSKQSNGGTPGFLNTLLGSHPLPQDRVDEASNRVLELPYHPTADPPVTVNTSPRTQARVLEGQTISLQRSLELAGLTLDPGLQQRSHRLASSNQRGGIVRTYPAQTSLSTMESELLKNDLRPGNRFGITVSQIADGQQRVTLVLN